MKQSLGNVQKNSVWVCVDQYEDDAKGRAYSLISEQEICFDSFMDLLLKMDSLFDEVCYPQAFEEVRSFVPKNESKKRYTGIPESKLDASWIQEQRGKLDTYEILVVSRRRVNWQGKAYRIEDETQKEVLLGEFQSEMDLLRMLKKREV